MKAGFDFYRDDVIIAHDCFYVLHHGGQNSPEYARLSKISTYYNPGPRGNDDPDQLDWAQQEIYRNLCAKHGVPSDIKEDKIEALRNNGMIEYKLYDHWASSLVNGDDSGLENEDMEAIDSFLKSENLGSCVDVWDDSEFGRPECGGLPGSVSTFVFYASPECG
jgi:hypothetical protein